MRSWLGEAGHTLLDGVENGSIDALELHETQARFAQEIDGELNAFLKFAEPDAGPPQGALEMVAPELGPRMYNSLPYAAKDIFTTTGIETTAASNMLRGYVPPYDAHCVGLLNEARCGLIGKTNLDEFAMGSSGENSAYGDTRNPWHRDYVPGGSSSGSAAAVAALQAPLALGTDTGGSVRQPASFCGIVGYRPTYGTVSRRGMIAFSSSCDQAAFFTRSSLDCALAMNTVSQPDPLDSTCVPPADVDYYAEAQREVHWNKLRIGVIRPFMDAARIDAPVLDCVNSSIRQLIDQGAEIVELDLPLLELALPAYYIITAAECSSNLARFDGIRYGLGKNSRDGAPSPSAAVDEPQDSGGRQGGPPTNDLLSHYINIRSNGFGAEVRRRILLGTYVLSAGYGEKYYDNARALRRDITASVMEAFGKVDVIATPTSPTLAFKLGARTQDPLKMYLADMCTVFVNLFGGCGISLPCGFGEDAHGTRLPVGLQFVAPPFHDHLLLRIAAQYEKLTDWKYEPPAWIAERLKAEG
jgi:aspartyl-tRNA(Asn)/glutamyl-tRNA(Gln) amidotransferase subunit A